MNDTDIELSIIIPLYNCERYLVRTLDCLERQGVFNESVMRVEIIMVDDGSTDKTMELASQAAEKYSQVHIFRQQNSGQHMARNLGLKNARGRYVYMMDDDDIIMDGTLGLVLGKCRERDVDVIHFDYLKSSEMNLEEIRYSHPLRKSVDVMYDGDGIGFIDYTRRIGNHYGLWTFVIRREFLEYNDIRFHEAIRWGEDLAFIWQLFLYNPSTLYLGFPGYVWMTHAESDSNQTHHDLRYRKMRRCCCHDLAIFFRELYNIFSSSLPASVARRLFWQAPIQVFAYWGMLLRCGIDDFDSEVREKMDEQTRYGIYPIPATFPSSEHYAMRGYIFRVMWHIVACRPLLLILLRIR